jgi:hypothetical protein
MPSVSYKRLYPGEEAVKKNSYKRGPRFGPDMIRHEQHISTPVVENPTQPVQVPVVEEKKIVVVDTTETIEETPVAPVLEQSEEIKHVVEPVVEKQQETTKNASERRRR